MKDKELSISSFGDNILVFSPHPDDEILGIGGLIAHLKEIGKKVNVVYVTNADSYSKPVKIFFNKRFCSPEEFIKIGMIKQDEAINALKEIGIEKENILFLCYPGGGLHKLLWDNYSHSNLYRAIGTKVNKSPYANCYKKNAPFCGESILEDIKNIINTVKPTDIFIPDPYDTHADHWATCIFTLLASGSIKSPLTPPFSKGGYGGIRLWSYLIHYDDWPSPKEFNTDLPLYPPGQIDDEWLSFKVPDIQKKISTLNAYKTVLKADSLYLQSFVRENEIVKLFQPQTISSSIAFKQFVTENYRNSMEKRIHTLNFQSSLRAMLAEALRETKGKQSHISCITCDDAKNLLSGRIKNVKILQDFIEKFDNKILENISIFIIYDYQLYRLRFRIRPKITNFNWFQVNSMKLLRVNSGI